ncbi:hypothetical protein HanRHA438_Chr07g0288791 [Helianthus annuus]|nr:hypothetical protein HanRHA438_Chr07g0288791 [Helianthus annuus]
MHLQVRSLISMLTNIKNAAIQPSNKNPSRNCDISSKAFFVFYLVVANGRLRNGLTGQNGSIPVGLAYALSFFLISFNLLKSVNKL